MMFFLGMVIGGLTIFLLKIAVSRLAKWTPKDKVTPMKVIGAINPEMKVVSGSNNCKGEWKNDCPYMVCECAKRESIDMDEDYRNDYTGIFGSIVFWIVVIVLVTIGFTTLYFL